MQWLLCESSMDDQKKDLGVSSVALWLHNFLLKELV